MKIDHIGIATRGLEDGSSFWEQVLGLEAEHEETVTAQKVRVQMFRLGESCLELLEATATDSPIARFLDKKGPGIHHLAVRVDDIRAAMDRVRAGGARLIDEEPRLGAGGCLVAFIHPSSTNGVLLELVEHPGEDAPPSALST